MNYKNGKPRYGSDEWIERVAKRPDLTIAEAEAITRDLQQCNMRAQSIKFMEATLWLNRSIKLDVLSLKAIGKKNKE